MMTSDEAKRLVGCVFKATFDRDKFKKFINNISLPWEFLSEGHRSGSRITDTFKTHIKSYNRLAKIRHNALNFDVLEIKLHKINQLENARTMQRSFVASYLNGSFGGSHKDGALAAFYCDDSPAWRFSLIYKDLGWKPEGGASVKFPPARRFSYLVGPEEPTHTAESQLADLLAEELSAPSPATLERLKEAFAVERVGNEFFIKYKALYDELSSEIAKALQNQALAKTFDKAGLTAEIYAKRLLGQLVFLYFLQKKGWLGVSKDQKWGQGHKNYLHRLFQEARAGKKSFFKSYLEPLFYEALAEDRQSEKYYYPPLKARIPFLNGGLFEPWPRLDWRTSKLDLPDPIFGKILEVFDRYNFTVREDEPLEKEVAVDPEMLGQVFENLLESQARKASGSFYTPRPIVHYMVKESLLRYLDQRVNCRTVFQGPKRQGSLIPSTVPETLLDAPEKQRREKIKWQDLADWVRGGGEMSAKEYKPDQDMPIAKAIKGSAQELDGLLREIKICDPAIGSGAFPVALLLEVVRLRLSLQHELEGKPQSAYDLKRETILNCIYGVDKDVSAVDVAKLRLWLSLVVDEESFDNIKPLPNLNYKIMAANSLASPPDDYDLFDKSNREKLTVLKQAFFCESDAERKKDLALQIDRQALHLKSGQSFDWFSDFCEIFQGDNPGFDIVIGNPPYIQLSDKNKIPPSEATRLQNIGYETFAKTGDIYCLFYEQGHRLLADNGVLIFITSNGWLKSDYGQALRKFLSSKANPINLINFRGQKIFKSAIVECNILMFQKSDNAGKTQTCEIGEEDSLNNLSVYVERNSGRSRFDSGESWSILSPIEQSIKRKIEAAGVPLKDKSWGISINYGIKTGCNEAFIIDGATKDKLIASEPKSAEIIRPILRGRDIKRYGYDFADQWLIASHNGLPDKNISRVDINKYPAVKKYLDGFSDKITKRYDKGDTHYNLRSCAYWEDFSKQKIIYSEISDIPKFAFDTEGEFCITNKAFYMIGNDLIYLLAFLNTKICKKYFYFIASTTGEGTIQWFKYKVESIPIPECKNTVKNDIIKFAKNIIRKNNAAIYEEQLNGIYNDIYQFNEEEIFYLSK